MGLHYVASRLLSYCVLKRLASRGGRNRSSTRLSAWGVNYEKGACTSPLFHFRKPQFSPRNPNSNIAFTVYVHARRGFSIRDIRGTENTKKKVSGRWGERPLGRGMEETVIEVRWACQTAGCAREQPNGTGALMLQETQRTPDYLPSLLCRRPAVHSSGDSFCPVLLARNFAAKLVRRYFSARRAPRSSASLS
jgi:hypothetical protein